MAVNEKNVKEMIDTRVGALTNAASETGDIIATLRYVQQYIGKGAGTALAAATSLVDHVQSIAKSAIAATPTAKSIEAYVSHRVPPTYGVSPSLAAGVSIPTNGGAWTYSAYQEVVAANGIATEYWVVGLAIDSPNPDMFQIDMATGGAGAETPVAVVAAQISAGLNLMLPDPIRVAANVRFAVRGASSVGNQNPGFKCKLLYATGL